MIIGTASTTTARSQTTTPPNTIKLATLSLFPPGYLFFAPSTIQQSYLQILIPLLWSSSTPIRKKAMSLLISDLESFLAGAHPNLGSNNGDGGNHNNDQELPSRSSTQLTMEEFYTHHGYRIPNHPLVADNDVVLGQFTPIVQIEIQNTFDDAIENQSLLIEATNKSIGSNMSIGSRTMNSSNNSSLNTNNSSTSNNSSGNNSSIENLDQIPISSPLNSHQNSTIEIVFDPFIHNDDVNVLLHPNYIIHSYHITTVYHLSPVQCHSLPPTLCPNRDIIFILLTILLLLFILLNHNHTIFHILIINNNTIIYLKQTKSPIPV